MQNQKKLEAWGDFFANGQLLYPFSDHTMQCCTRKPFWEAKREPQSCSASAFPYFEADAELGVIDSSLCSISISQGVKNGPAMLHGASGATRKGKKTLPYEKNHQFWKNIGHLFKNSLLKSESFAAGQLRGGKWHGEATYTTQVVQYDFSLSVCVLK